MWLIACGMNRSGSTLQYQIAVKVAQTQQNTQLVGWVATTQTAKVLGKAKDDTNTWYLAKLHDYDQEVDTFWNRLNPKALYIYRDIRDVVVSTMHMENWAFDSPKSARRSTARCATIATGRRNPVSSSAATKN